MLSLVLTRVCTKIILDEIKLLWISNYRSSEIYLKDMVHFMSKALMFKRENDSSNWVLQT